MEKILNIEYHHYERLSDMAQSDMELICEARRAAENAYSPFSHFAVGAAARLSSGEILRGTNIESEVFPAGMCAERVLLFMAASNHGDDPVSEIAVTSLSTSDECYPCGQCRQTLLDMERRQGSKIRVIMAGEDSSTVVDSATSLLPFAFKL